MLYFVNCGNQQFRQQKIEALATQARQPLHKMNLSEVMSKYIGETEKNLATLFKSGQQNNWILFFDEADALFAKRTSINDAHDRYANQQTNHFLEYLERYPGIVILATNLSDNLSADVKRRFKQIIQC